MAGVAVDHRPARPVALTHARARRGATGSWARERRTDGLGHRGHGLAAVQDAPHDEVVPVDAGRLLGVLRLSEVSGAADPDGREPLC